MEKTLRNIVAGIMIPVSVAGSSYLSGCEEKPTPAQRQVQKVEKQPEKQYTVEDLVDSMEIKIDNGPIVRLEHKGNGVYEGRQNNLVGSRMFEMKYSFNPRASRFKIVTEGSLFKGLEEDVITSEGIIEKGSYKIKAQSGKEIDLEIKYGPFPIKGDTFDFLRDTWEGLPGL